MYFRDSTCFGLIWIFQNVMHDLEFRPYFQGHNFKVTVLKVAGIDVNNNVFFSESLVFVNWCSLNVQVLNAVC